MNTTGKTPDFSTSTKTARNSTQAGTLLIALHGFGDTGAVFHKLQAFLPDHTTLLAPDLPFHGHHAWAEPYFTSDQLWQWLADLRAQYPQARVVLLGFSFGARLLLGMLPRLPELADEIHLVAPDGIATRGLRLANTLPFYWRKQIGQTIINHPWLLQPFFLIDRIFPDTTRRFMHRHLKSDTGRRRALGCWLSMHFFKKTSAATLAQIQDCPVPIKVFLGKNDEVIPASEIQNRLNGLGNVQIFVLDTGHKIIGEALGQALKKVL
jgi:pimeloyl-ACP methyl ester carboxylesterase